MQKIIITGGPTNEYIDEVMKITNMSTGSLSVNLAKLFLDADYQVTLILNHSVNADKLEQSNKAKANLEIVRVETTEEMTDALIVESKKGKADVLIHAAAVGDYKGEYTFLLEDMAAYLWNRIERGEIKSMEDVLSAFENKDAYSLDNSSKISSYQQNLTVKLGLTFKIISKLRELYPDTILIGCKLLEDVSKEELYEAAQHLCTKNDMDYIMANDLAELRSGDSSRHVVTKEGYMGKRLADHHEIFSFVSALI